MHVVYDLRETTYGTPACNRALDPAFLKQVMTSDSLNGAEQLNVEIKMFLLAPNGVRPSEVVHSELDDILIQARCKRLKLLLLLDGGDMVEPRKSCSSVGDTMVAQLPQTHGRWFSKGIEVGELVVDIIRPQQFLPPL